MPTKHIIVIYDDADNAMDLVLVTNSQSDEVVDQLPKGWRIEKVS